MKIMTFATAALRPARRCLTVFGSLSPVAVIGLTLGIVVGGMGIADAATGGNFLLGKANTETSKATLSNSKGTPLSLVAPKNTAPLSVSNETMVPNLNAELVGGLSASTLRSTGGDGYLNSPQPITLLSTAITEVASTGKLPAGIYYATATAEIKLSGNPGAECFITINKNTSRMVQEGGSNGGPLVTIAETGAVTLGNNATLKEYCEVQGPGSSSTVQDSAITAIRVLSSHGTKPFKADAAHAKDAK